MDAIVEIQDLGSYQTVILILSLIEELLADLLSIDQRFLIQRLKHTDNHSDINIDTDSDSSHIDENCSKSIPVSTTTEIDIATRRTFQSFMSSANIAVTNRNNNNSGYLPHNKNNSHSDSSSSTYLDVLIREIDDDMTINDGDYEEEEDKDELFVLLKSLAMLVKVNLYLHWPLKNAVRFMHNVRSAVLGTERYGTWYCTVL